MQRFSPLINDFLQVVILSSTIRSSFQSADILLRTSVVSVWHRASLDLISLSFTFLAILDISIAALHQGTLLWDANIAATIEAAEASLWTVWAGEDKVKT